VSHETDSNLGFQKAEIKTKKNTYQIKTKMLGEHQLENMKTAIIASEKINPGVSKASIEKGINNTYWPARLEVIQNKPLVILDGSHNFEGFKTLRKFLSTHIKGKFKKIILVLGMSDDKEHEKIISLIADFPDEIIVCQAEYEGTPTAKLEKIIKKCIRHNVNIIEVKKTSAAVEKALANAKKDALSTVILITGSLYMAGEAYFFFNHRTPT
jgi:dihydrofolate synthase/folylpolyglutamate synthase